METFKHHFYIIHKATVDKSELVLSVWGEQCHQIDDNKLRANSGRKRSIFSIDIVNRIIICSTLQTKHVQDSPSSLARVQDDRFHDSCTGAKLVLHACKTKACKSPDSGPSNAGAGKSVQAGLQRLAERARACKSVQERARACKSHFYQ